MDEDALITTIKEEVKNLTKYLTSPIDYQNAINDALRETGWTLPVTTNFKIYWIKNRARRHLFFMLLSESAHKFKYEQINLQHRFEHYSKLVKSMDDSFIAAQEANPSEFSGVDPFKQFGTVAGTGFAYEPLTGRDISYRKDQEVIFNPSETD